MSNWHHSFRRLPIAALVASSFVSPVSAQPEPPPQAAAASPLPAEPVWVVNLEALPQRSSPDEDGEPIANLRQFTYLEVTGYKADWAVVLNPRTRQTGFVPSDELGMTSHQPASL